MAKKSSKVGTRGKVYDGRYFVIAKDKEKATKVVSNVEKDEPDVLLLTPRKQVTYQTLSRAAERDIKRRSIRITPKRPRIR